MSRSATRRRYFSRVVDGDGGINFAFSLWFTSVFFDSKQTGETRHSKGFLFNTDFINSVSSFNQPEVKINTKAKLEVDHGSR